MTGVVFDPTNLSTQEELRSEVRQRGLWAVLDSRLMELATRNGHTERRDLNFRGRVRNLIDLKI